MIRMNEDVIDALAVFRIARLVVDDRVPFGKPREAIRKRALEAQKTHGPGEPDPYLLELLECYWCVSMHVGFMVLVLRRFGWWRPLAKVLAASAVAGLAAKFVAE